MRRHAALFAPRSPRPSILLALVAVAAVSSGPAGAQETTLWIPAAAETDGAAGTFWRTDLAIFNPGSASLAVEIALVGPTSDPTNPASARVDVGPRRAVALSGVLGTTLKTSGAGSLRLRASEPFLAQSWTTTAASAGGRNGVDVPAVSSSLALQSGVLVAANDASSAGRRTNVGILNPGASAADVTLRLLVDGTAVGETQLSLASLGWSQVNDLFAVLGRPEVTSSAAVVEVSATSSVLAYATIVDRASGDGTYALAQADSGSSAAPAFLMALHTCDPARGSCSDPRNHVTRLARSTDGKSWSAFPGFTPFDGSVPDVVRRGQTLYVYTPQRLVRYHLDTGVQEGTVTVTVEGLEAGIVDPSPVLDSDGRVVLFFLRGRPGSDPAGCPSGVSSCLQQFGSATEVDGSDGARFRLDGGDRASITVGTAATYRSASDPDIFFDGRQWVLYVSHGPSVSAWTSATLQGTFAKVGDLTTGTGGVPAGHFDAATARYWTYVHAPSTPGGPNVIRRAVHDALDMALAATSLETVVGPAVFGLAANVSVESPGIALDVP